MTRLIVIFLLFPLFTFAQTGEENIIELEEPNTLSEFADETIVTNAYKLTIKGPMSNDDLRFLNDALFSKPEYNNFVEYIQWLDLSEAKIMPMYGTNWLTEKYGTRPFVPVGSTAGHQWWNIPTPGDELPCLSFAGAKSLHHIQLPKVRFIEKGLLFEADALEEIIFQEGLDSLANWTAMHANSIKQVYLPSTLMYIGNLFISNAKPDKLVCAAPIPPELVKRDYSKMSGVSNADTFNKTDIENCDLYVPYGSKALYEAAEQWRDFRSITECDTEKMREEMEPGSKQTGVEAHSAVTGTTAVYDLRGVQQKGLRRGLNIVRSGDGKARLMIQTHGK